MHRERGDKTAEGAKTNEVSCSVGNKEKPTSIIHSEGRIKIQFVSPEVIHEGEVLAIEINEVEVRNKD